MERKVIVIVGRPNVGKSTLFNRLTGKWNSIVEDKPGITRDRIKAHCILGGCDFTLIDTGGLQIDPKTKVEKKMSAMALKGIDEADLILFVLDGRAGVSSLDREWIQRIRKIKKPKLFLVNKLDVRQLDERVQEFYELGVEPLILLSCEKGRGFDVLEQEALAALGLSVEDSFAIDHQTPTIDFSVAITGRPNVGKSTLLNALLQEERCLVDDEPGTTRDPIHGCVKYRGKEYRFIDTAGIRKRAKATSRVEKFSLGKSLKTIEESDLVLLLVDGISGPTEQDAHVAGAAFEKNKPMILIVNKWDIGKDKFTKEEFENRLEFKMNFLQNVPVLYVSAKTGKNFDKIFSVIEKIRVQYERIIKTGELNKAFKYIIDHHPMPSYNGQAIKMYYATQVSQKPPSFLVFCNYPRHVHFTYKRYLINALREAFELQDVPVRVIFKQRERQT